MESRLVEHCWAVTLLPFSSFWMCMCGDSSVFVLLFSSCEQHCRESSVWKIRSPFFLDAVMQNHTGRARVFHYYFLPHQLFEAFTGNHTFKTVVCFLNATFRNNTVEKNMQPNVSAFFFLVSICKLPLPVISDDFLSDPHLISYSKSYYVTLYACFLSWRKSHTSIRCWTATAMTPWPSSLHNRGNTQIRTWSMERRRCLGHHIQKHSSNQLSRLRQMKSKLLSLSISVSLCVTLSPPLSPPAPSIKVVELTCSLHVSMVI